MNAILYIAHGSRVASSQQAVFDFFDHFFSFSLAPIQQVCFLELADPDIATGIQRCVQQGATTITAVPFLLFATSHAKEDIPLQLQEAANLYPDVTITYGSPLGISDQMIKLLHRTTNHVLQEKYLAIASPTFAQAPTIIAPADSVILIVGRGSSDPDIYRYFQNIKQRYQAETGYNQVHTCFLAASQPSFVESLVELLAKRPKQLIIIPYLLFRGVLTNDMIRSLRELHLAVDSPTTCIIAQPLADDAALPNILRDNTTEALCSRRYIHVPSPT